MELRTWRRKWKKDEWEDIFDTLKWHVGFLFPPCLGFFGATAHDALQRWASRWRSCSSTNHSSALSACGGLYHKLHIQHFASLPKHVTKQAAVFDRMSISFKTGERNQWISFEFFLAPRWRRKNCKDVMIIMWCGGLFDVRYLLHITPRSRHEMKSLKAH